MSLIRQFTLLPALALVSVVSAQSVTGSSKEAPPRAVVAQDRGGATAPVVVVTQPWWESLPRDEARQGLPFVHETRSLERSTTGFTAHLTGTRFEALSPEDLALLPGLGNPGPEPEVHAVLGVQRKKPMALVDIYPYRRNPSTGVVERLVSYDLQLVQQRRVGGGALRNGTYPEHSKMKDGSWFRFTVPHDGVYKLSYAFMQSLGVDMNGLAFDRVNVYGNHQGQLPFTNTPFIPTDLMANAIEVVDNGDGQFGQNDHILFYATGAQRWDYHAASGRFRHTKNVYTDSASYFIGLDVEAPKRMGTVEQATDPATDQITAFTDRQVIDRDLTNLIKSGRTWVGETYDITTTYNYAFSVPSLRAQDTLCLEMSTLSRTIGTGNSSTWQVNAGGYAFTYPDSGINGVYSGPYADDSESTQCFTTSGSNIPISVTFLKHDPVSSMGWMNYLRINCRRDLRMTGDQLAFREPRTVGAGRVGEFTMDQASSVHRIWDITDPADAMRVLYTDGGNIKTFRLPTEEIREFIAFRNAGYPEPTPIGEVPQQDLHASALPVDMVIICPKELQSEAQRLAQRRSDEGLIVMMVDPQQIYNEFSSGQRDAAAIKRFMRLLYDKAEDQEAMIPRYLLLFGDGSYNNVNSSATNQNLIPTYQTVNSWVPSSCYTSDDYFVLLDDNEGESVNDLVDIGVGRLPVSSLTQANEAVNKILNYDKLMLSSAGTTSCATGNDGGASDWRNWALFASDDMNGDGPPNEVGHMSNSNALANKVELLKPCLNVSKIYMDAYVQQSTPGGQRYPEASVALRDRVQKGALLVNYVGHGGEVGWAHERFLDIQTINGWTNLDRLPLFVTATCEFTRWDDPGRTSAGELVFLNPAGGGIGLMTTTRIAYSGQNFALCNAFYDHVFDAADELGNATRFGDIYRRTKVQVTTANPSTNYRNFALIGDPSCRLALARNSARIIAITDTLGNEVDTLRALAVVRIRGEVTDTNGTMLSDFNGTVIPTVFDKASTIVALQNDGGNQSFSFQTRRNIIHRGRATVANGQFEFTFVVPKDINYQFGPGRVSVYVESDQTNGCGYYNTPIVGGSDPNATADEQGPRIDLFMNDERFVPGGITNEEPLLLAKLFDDNGINTLGSSIGHDLTAVIDANTEQAIVLNDVYEADKDTYKSGQVRYRLSELPEGAHTLDLKAWDVFNNSNQKSLEFVVSPSAELALEHVLNYPNPFTTSTQFYFEHNRPCGDLDVQVQVFTVAGRLVKTMNRQLRCEGFRSEPLAWDGLDDNGDKLGRGVYVYRLSVENTVGEKADKVDKLVILR